VDAATDAPGPADAVAERSAPAAFGCPVLPVPAGPTIMVRPGTNLVAVVAGAAQNTTILIADGTYALAGATIHVTAVGVTLRSASGDATKVVIDGGYMSPEDVAISASNVTLAHLTITRAINHPVHIYPDGYNVAGTRLYGLRLVDGGEQFVKVNPDGARTFYVDQGTVECSTFLMTDAGRPHVESLGGTSCYTGGIDVHGGLAWVVRQNHFEGIYCTTGFLSEHAIHFWNGARDTLVEDNVIVNCARGIGFGLVETGEMRVYPDDPSKGVGYIGHFDGIIRNNFVFANVAPFDTGIELDQARGTRVYHNTVYAGPGATKVFSSIDYRFADTKVDLRDNLVGRITQRDGAMATASNNKEGVAASDFKDAANGDLHLAATATDAIDQGLALPEAGLDIDGEPHAAGAAPDLGADEAR
jgi:hypothetical protein